MANCKWTCRNEHDLLSVAGKYCILFCTTSSLLVLNVVTPDIYGASVKIYGYVRKSTIQHKLSMHVKHSILSPGFVPSLHVWIVCRISLLPMCAIVLHPKRMRNKLRRCLNHTLVIQIANDWLKYWPGGQSVFMLQVSKTHSLPHLQSPR